MEGGLTGPSTESRGSSPFSNPLLDRWDDGETLFGFFVSSGAAISAAVIAAADSDYICIDMQHGIADFAHLYPLVLACQTLGSSPIVRVPANDPWMIMRALDFGARGVIVPLIDDADDAKRAVSACRYPPSGKRSYGPTASSVLHGTNSPRDLERVACILMIETEEGLANVQEIASVEGVDALYVGPSDLSLALGLLPGQPDTMQQPRLLEAIGSVLEACQAYDVVPGINCFDGVSAGTYAAQGFRMVTVGNDVRLLRTSAHRELSSARRMIKGTGKDQS